MHCSAVPALTNAWLTLASTEAISIATIPSSFIIPELDMAAQVVAYRITTASSVSQGEPTPKLYLLSMNTYDHRQ